MALWNILLRQFHKRISFAFLNVITNKITCRYLSIFRIFIIFPNVADSQNSTHTKKVRSIQPNPVSRKRPPLPPLPSNRIVRRAHFTILLNVSNKGKVWNVSLWKFPKFLHKSLIPGQSFYSLIMRMKVQSVIRWN